MRSTLTELGFDVPKRNYGYGDDVQENAETVIGNGDGHPKKLVPSMSSEKEVAL